MKDYDLLIDFAILSEYLYILSCLGVLVFPLYLLNERRFDNKDILL